MPIREVQVVETEEAAPARVNPAKPFIVKGKSVYGPIGDHNDYKSAKDAATGSNAIVDLILFAGAANRLPKDDVGAVRAAKALAKELNAEWKKDWKAALVLSYKYYSGDISVSRVSTEEEAAYNRALEIEERPQRLKAQVKFFKDLLKKNKNEEEWIRNLWSHNVRTMEQQLKAKAGAETADAKATSATILKQLGGGKFLAMTGAKNIVYGKDKATGREYLNLQLPTRGKKPNNVKIIYDKKLDLYHIEYYKFSMRKLEIKKIKIVEDLDVQGMRDSFESTTGLRLSL